MKRAVATHTTSISGDNVRGSASKIDEAKPRQFPEGFLWGASTAAYQVEGGIENTDWAEAARQGKVPPCGRACDHYNRFEGDFDLAVNLGHNAHRFSIEWARIEPEEGKFDEREIEHYRQVLQALKARNLTPFVTLWHFTQPLWFSQSGGFLRADSDKVFARYCRYVVERLGEEATFWITQNEPQIIATNGYLRGKFPPFRVAALIDAARLMRRMAAAHRAAFVSMKNVAPLIKIGVATHNNYFDASGNVLMRPVAALLSYVRNRWFLEMIDGHQDFIGLNHYLHNRLSGKAVGPRSDMGWEVSPESLYRCVMELTRYKLPIYITESGVADRRDVLRKDYILGYLRSLHRAIAEGADVRGYLHWALIDNYEWTEGFDLRFGLIEMDYNTLTRSIRPSARVYEDICRRNALPAA